MSENIVSKIALACKTLHTLNRCAAVAASPVALESAEMDRTSLQVHNELAICGAMAGRSFVGVEVRRYVSARSVAADCAMIDYEMKSRCCSCLHKKLSQAHLSPKLCLPRAASYQLQGSLKHVLKLTCLCSTRLPELAIVAFSPFLLSRPPRHVRDDGCITMRLQ